MQLDAKTIRYKVIRSFSARLELSDAHYRKAVKNLETAELLFNHGHLDETIDTLCNALFHFMQSLLTLTGRQAHEYVDAILLTKRIFISKHENDPKLQEFLENTSLPSHVYDELNWIRKIRNEARYSPTILSEATLKEAINKVTHLMEELSPYLTKLYCRYQELSEAHN